VCRIPPCLLAKSCVPSVGRCCGFGGSAHNKQPRAMRCGTLAFADRRGNVFAAGRLYLLKGTATGWWLCQRVHCATSLSRVRKRHARSVRAPRQSLLDPASATFASRCAGESAARRSIAGDNGTRVPLVRGRWAHVPDAHVEEAAPIRVYPCISLGESVQLAVFTFEAR
jgi:hypothetical protein